MSQAQQGLDGLFTALANHSELIAQAYFTGAVYKDDQNQRALNQLKQLKILVTHSADGYRIAGRLSELIDSALSSDRIRRLDTDWQVGLKHWNNKWACIRMPWMKIGQTIAKIILWNLNAWFSIYPIP